MNRTKIKALLIFGSHTGAGKIVIVHDRVER
jgi:hypothetical protein